VPSIDENRQDRFYRAHRDVSEAFAIRGPFRRQGLSPTPPCGGHREVVAPLGAALTFAFIDRVAFT